MSEEKITTNPTIDRMFKAGAHFGYLKSRRHPSIKPLIFGSKNKVEIFDLEKTHEYLEKAKEFVKTLGSQNGKVLFIGSKNEAQIAIEKTAQSLNMPYVAGRWIGGTFTNYPQIKKRIDRLEMLVSQKEKGELGKYTKKERLMIDREIEKMQRYFSGITSMKDMPKALFVIDSKHEYIAVTEAHKIGIPVISICGSDCNLKDVEFPIPGNDASTASISFFLNEIADAYRQGQMQTKSN
jgi:small subunit ribosomal protein S2